MNKRKSEKHHSESLTEKIVSISIWFFFFSALFAVGFYVIAFWTWILALSFGIQFQWKYVFGMMVLVYLFGKPNRDSKKIDKIIDKINQKIRSKK